MDLGAFNSRLNRNKYGEKTRRQGDKDFSSEIALPSCCKNDFLLLKSIVYQKNICQTHTHASTHTHRHTHRQTHTHTHVPPLMKIDMASVIFSPGSTEWDTHSSLLRLVFWGQQIGKRGGEIGRASCRERG